jgi:hypothetical protein
MAGANRANQKQCEHVRKTSCEDQGHERKLEEIAPEATPKAGPWSKITMDKFVQI